MSCTSLPFSKRQASEAAHLGQQDTLRLLPSLPLCYLFIFPFLVYLFHFSSIKSTFNYPSFPHSILFSFLSFFQRNPLPVCLSTGEQSKYWYNSYGFPALRATSLLSHVFNGAPGSPSLYLNKKRFTQLSTDWEHSRSFTESLRGNKMAACWQ